MKNILTIEHQLTQIPITFCYNEKTFKKYCKKILKAKNHFMDSGGVCETWETDGKVSYVVGMKAIDDIYSYKALLVHELNHVVTNLMKFSKIEDDEYRSYTLQWLYLEIMPFLDNLLRDK